MSEPSRNDANCRGSYDGATLVVSILHEHSRKFRQKSNNYKLLDIFNGIVYFNIVNINHSRVFYVR